MRAIAFARTSSLTGRDSQPDALSSPRVPARLMRSLSCGPSVVEPRTERTSGVRVAVPPVTGLRRPEHQRPVEIREHARIGLGPRPDQVRARCQVFPELVEVLDVVRRQVRVQVLDLNVVELLAGV